MCHTLNLSVTVFLAHPEISAVFKKARSVVGYFIRNVVARSELEQLHKTYGETKGGLITDVPTRWGSGHDMALALYQHRRSILEYDQKSGKSTSDYQSMKLTDTDWDVLADSICVLDPFSEISKLLGLRSFSKIVKERTIRVATISPCRLCFQKFVSYSS